MLFKILIENIDKNRPIYKLFLNRNYVFKGKDICRAAKRAYLVLNSVSILFYNINERGILTRTLRR